MRYYLLLFFILSFQQVFGQFVLKGKVIDSSTGDPVPYASVTIGYSQGTACNSHGIFILKANGVSTNDTLIFSSIGFNSTAIIVKDFLASKIKTVKITPKNYQITEVTVTGEKIKKGKLYGITKKRSNSTFSIFGLGVIVAQYIENPHQYKGKIKSIRFYNTGRHYDPNFKFRLHLYSVDSSKLIPGKELLPENVIVNVPSAEEGWISIDVLKYNINFSKNGIFAAIEYLAESCLDGKYVRLFTENEKKALHINSGAAHITSCDMLGYYYFLNGNTNTFVSSSNGRVWDSWEKKSNGKVPYPNIMLSVEVIK